MKPFSLLALIALLPLSSLTPSSRADETLTKSLVLHASFDRGFDADFSKGDPIAYVKGAQGLVPLPAGTEEVLIAPGAGKFGGALSFPKKGTTRLTYKGDGVLGYNDKDWSATVSLWLRLTPDEDLEPGYCDPIQIIGDDTKKGLFFVDFDKDLPRVFRLGVFPDFKTWNPQNTPWEQIASEQRPMVPVARPPFLRSTWTHVAWTFTGANTGGNDGLATLYLNGRSMGTLKRPLTFTWQPEKTAIMLGIAYTGDFDELSIHDRALSAAEIESLYRLPKGLTPLISTTPGSP